MVWVSPGEPGVLVTTYSEVLLTGAPPTGTPSKYSASPRLPNLFSAPTVKKPASPSVTSPYVKETPCPSPFDA